MKMVVRSITPPSSQTIAALLGKVTGALHLRTLQTLNDLSSDQSNTVVFAVPLEILRGFESMASKFGGDNK